MTDQELIRALRNAAARWEKEHPIIGVGSLRYCDALRDAADRLTSLMKDLGRVTRERDAAVEDLRVASIEGDMDCNWCAGQTDRTRCYNCSFANEWKWRGQKEE